MEVVVNWWGVLAATVASMVVGSIWYAKPVFGKPWMKMVGITDKDMEKGGWTPMVIAILASVVTAYVLAHVAYLSFSFFADVTFMGAALTTAFWVWLGFTAVRFLTHDSFEGRPLKLTSINSAHELVTLLAMAVALGLVGLPVV
jgi:hypothetical protein